MNTSCCEAVKQVNAGQALMIQLIKHGPEKHEHLMKQHLSIEQHGGKITFAKLIC